MQSIVLGASGIVGGHILAQLLTAGEQPIALSRSPPTDLRPVQWIKGDLAEAHLLRLPPARNIYCTAHSLLLANALPMLACDALRRVVLFTSTSIVTKIDSLIVAERDGLQRLVEGERRVMTLCDHFGISLTVLRPTMIYDEGRDANVTQLAGVIRRFGVMPLSGAGRGLRQPVHAEDLAIGALRAAASAGAANKVYALPGRDTITYREMVGRIFDSLHKPRLIVSLPPLLWRAAFALGQPIFPNANAAMGDRMSKDMVFDAAPAIADFGWNPRGFRPQFAAF